MGSRWREEPFASLASLNRETVHPENAAGLPYVGLEHIGEGTLQLTGIGVAEDASSLKSRFREGDILFGKLRPYFRKVVRARFDGICSTDIWVVRPRPGVDRDYLFYLMASPGFLEPIVRASEGTKMPRAKWDYAAALSFPVPSPAEQQSIAGILASLDDKIELNRRMAESLDDIAQTLFRMWFVEPAKHAWPSGGEELPEGWKVERLGEHVDSVRGLSYTSAGLGELGEGLPMHNLNSISFARGYQPSGLKWFTGAYKERNRVRAGDLLVANVDVTQNLEVIGSPAIVPTCFGEESVFSADLFRVQPKPNSPLSIRYLYMMLRDPRFHRIVVGYANGTTVNHLSPDALSVPGVVVPPKALVSAFDSVVHPMLERRDELESESDTLREIRDALLPPLLDGRVEVPAMQDEEGS